MRHVFAPLALVGALLAAPSAFAQPLSAWDVAQAWPQHRATASVIASFYDCARPGQCSRSKRTASGERFNAHAFTAAHRSFAFGTRLRVCGKGADCVVVRVNDRGPFIAGRTIDLSRAAAQAIHLGGVGRVTIERI